ncbi:hypothetical protein GF358_01690 [Candidatus Woesearchaeota archaeon]|nr:hypothetical protein [Candidatus Woesearchaeota archaeon]
MKLKRRLSEKEEFEIMKLVLDKFLWLGFGILAFGIYRAIMYNFYAGIWFIAAGIILLVIFAWFIAREFEFAR